MEKFGSKYMFICDKLPYDEAQADCTDMGGDLVTINSRKEVVSFSVYYITNES